MTEDELVALLAIQGTAIDVCWDNHMQLWSGIVVFQDSKFFTESSDNRDRLLHEIAGRTLGRAYDGKGIISADH